MAKSRGVSGKTGSGASSSLGSLHALFDPVPLFSIAVALRAVLLVYGAWQDAHSAVKYTDIDYLVFTDAARIVASSPGDGSPYDRATYRYTPLLAWLLAPTAHRRLFDLGKVLFALADLVAGWLALRLLLRRGTPARRAGAFAALWLWNPMVAAISTRGSAEGLLGALTMGLLWAVERRRVALAGVLLGLAVHVKIYPFIYAPAIVWWMDEKRMATAMGSSGSSSAQKKKEKLSLIEAAIGFVTAARVKLAAVSLATFALLNALMYSIYGMPFLVHTYFHHVTRIDHRHNFSPYNVLLYINSAATSSAAVGDTASAPPLRTESLAFLPQLLLSCVLIPLALAKKDLATSMMAQTFAFVTFNKVCTSQYFLWYMVFLPLYLPGSSMLRSPRLGITALVLWVVAQAAWLQQGYELEFLGKSTFVPGLWLASLFFFLVNCWILGIIISDGAERSVLRKEVHYE
ncbi:Mannosyltransferase, DXD [Cordyceps fumosorosea ARSEF 2679]|uniref:GPI mannosyltransferase 1 n=1 Tax=Cordyceps fumosorosea (strain ARSEF 2679) TaxID=1081104 RepID=A0A167V5A2_CORFA|nr:Mannosyltransferase, DXD [Cordyceps fumosorosea ARSEF 2679]OAA62239.1 Mannosyltransferase, DXD [Cordyceps fumosorosea ARSEF 2679]